MLNIPESLILSYESKRCAEIRKIFQLADVEELEITKYRML